MSKPKFKIGDKVRILDGRKIEGYNAGWVSEMDEYVGASATVRRVESWFADAGGFVYQLTGVDGVESYSWDERGLEKVLRAKHENQKIIIYRYGQSVIAKDYSTGKAAKAKCSPEDEFDFHKGAALAFDRLLGREEKKPEYYNGKVVCVRKGPGVSGDVDVTWWTVGKIYDVVDGVIRDDSGDPRIPVESLTELNWLMTNFAEFIALVE